jgi:hypothetical protein
VSGLIYLDYSKYILDLLSNLFYKTQQSIYFCKTLATNRYDLRQLNTYNDFENGKLST